MEIVIDGYKIAYKESGAGDNVIVILQGWGTNMVAYDSVAACVNTKYRVIQLDFPGFGDSDEPRDPWAVEDYARFMVKFMDALHIEKASLIGHSYGGRVIIRLAARPSLPFEISNIVLIDSAGILPKKTWKQKLKIKTYKVMKKITALKPILSTVGTDRRLEKPSGFGGLPQCVADDAPVLGESGQRRSDPLAERYPSGYPADMGGSGHRDAFVRRKIDGAADTRRRAGSHKRRRSFQLFRSAGSISQDYGVIF